MSIETQLTRIDAIGVAATTICTALCSDSGLLASMNKHLSELMFEIEDKTTGLDQVWRPEHQSAILIFIEATAHQVSEVVNGNIRR